MVIPLIVRSAYSFHRGTVQPAALAGKARSAGFPALALTDRNGLYGLPVFLSACSSAGILPIIGTELVYEGDRAVLIARTKDGFSVLTRLLTAMKEQTQGAGTAFAPEKSQKPIPAPVWDARAAVLGCLSCPRQAESIFILSDDMRLLAMVPHENASVYALLTPGNKASWRRLLQLGIPPVYSPEISFLRPEERDTQRLLCAIGRQTTVHAIQESELDPAGTVWDMALKPDPAVPVQALEANHWIAGQALHKPFDGFVFPRFQGRSSEGSASELLKNLVMEGAERRYGRITPQILDRISYELSLIEQKGFSDYFLVVKDIVSKASRICGRGSAAASIVSYCLGITDVDPIAHGLYFDRFLNPGREDPPDIDVDFAWDERDALLASVVSTYGEEHAARVANHLCFRFRSALRETARAYGIPDEETTAFERAMRVNKAEALAHADSVWQTILAKAESLTGLPRFLGAHSGGMIIVPDTLADHVPLEKTGNGIRVIAWDKDGAEDAGLVKIDLLGNRSLAVVRDALANIQANGIQFDTANWHPIDDPKTVDLLSRGDTMGVFYVESPAMRQLQKKTGKGDFNHLVIHSSIIRPAANRFINEYIDRLHGKPWESLHPLLGELFAETYGILCYQEDVSKAAIALAGFSSSEADGIRKVLSKKDAAARLETYRARFFEGAIRKGVAPEVIDAVWDMIVSFSGYSFVKAHSASYAMLSFQSAYLRAHFPAEFMAAVLSNHGGFYSTLAYVSEARRMGIRVLPPDVNASGLRCAGKSAPEKPEIRFGLAMIASLDEKTAQAIVEDRQHSGPYRSVTDFARRVRLSRTDAESLVGSGALDHVEPEPKARSRILLDLLLACSEREHSTSDGDLFGLGHRELRKSSNPAAPHQSTQAQLPKKYFEAEMRYLGTTLAIHPLMLWPKLFYQQRTRAAELAHLAGKKVRLLVWPITSKQVLTSSEELMEFVSFEDETGLIEAVLFPDGYRAYRHLLFEERPLWVSGEVQLDRGAAILVIESITLPEVPLDKNHKSIKIGYGYPI